VGLWPVVTASRRPLFDLANSMICFDPQTPACSSYISGRLHSCGNDLYWKAACLRIREAGKHALREMESLRYSTGASGDGDVVGFRMNTGSVGAS
jgi:hypothetical protein